MKSFSQNLMISQITSARKARNMTQQKLADAAQMNRGMIIRLEAGDYMPSLEQLGKICAALDLDPTSFYINNSASTKLPKASPRNIAVAGTGYVGLSIAVLLSQNNHVEAVDIIPEKVEMLNQRKSPIQDNEIEEYLDQKDLDLTATLDGESAYKPPISGVVIAAPTEL